MNRLECDVIRDLLPSYVDGICSEATRRCVEEHLQDCPGCEQLMRQLRDTDLSTNKLEQREFDGYKRAKRQIRRQSVSGALFVLSLALSAALGAWLIGHSGAESIKTYYALLGICILCTINYANSRRPECRMQRADWAIAALSTVVTAYLCPMLCYCLMGIINETPPFGIPFGYQLGYFIRYQLNGAAIFQLLLFAVLLRRLMKRNINNGWALVLCLAGAAMTHICETFFGALDLSGSFRNEQLIPAFLTDTGIALTIGLAGVALSLILSRVRVKKG